jgi:hypothetical protein
MVGPFFPESEEVEVSPFRGPTLPSGRGDLPSALGPNGRAEHGENARRKANSVTNMVKEINNSTGTGPLRCRAIVAVGAIVTLDQQNVDFSRKACFPISSPK